MKRERDIGEYFGGGKRAKVANAERKAEEPMPAGKTGGAAPTPTPTPTPTQMPTPTPSTATPTPSTTTATATLKTTTTATSTPSGLSAFKQRFREKLTEEQRELLALEIDTMEDGWFEALADVFTQEWFLALKRFVQQEYATHTVYPPRGDVYAWSRLTPLATVRCVILGQDPYHGPGQAHGLAFSVRAGTRLPPSLRNIYKGVQADYPAFAPPTAAGGTAAVGDLTGWARQGVLLLNTVLTVRAGHANSHAGRGWERFTRDVLARAVASASASASAAASADCAPSVVVIAWGKHAERVVEQVVSSRGSSRAAGAGAGGVHVLTGCHPSPLSAHRGFFEQGHFRKANELLPGREVDWGRL